jgi:hypothetical protein
MRKRIINPVQQQNVPPDQNWLNMEKLAVVEITSEDDAYPIESALLPGKAPGWRAAGPGKQTIRLLFNNPQRLQWIRLHFEETNIERTQEYVLRWSPDSGQSYQEIVRQQWNFSPQGATSETEDYQVELPSVTVLELSINPDISGKNAFASLERLRLA